MTPMFVCLFLCLAVDLFVSKLNQAYKANYFIFKGVKITLFKKEIGKTKIPDIKQKCENNKSIFSRD